MYIRVSNGSNATTVDIDLTGTEQWRVSLGARSITQTSTAGTLQDARNEHGTLPLSLTLMVKGGTKEKNRAIISRILSRMQGKVEIGKLKGHDGLTHYENFVFIGSLKSYSINESTERWFTVTMIFDCERWLTENGYNPVIVRDRDGEHAFTEYYDFLANVTGGYDDSQSAELVEKHRADDPRFCNLPGLLPTPMALSVARGVESGADSLPTVTITATSDDTPENNWVMSFKDFPANHELILTAPHPGSDDVFSFRFTGMGGAEEDPDAVIDRISGWPVYAGGHMTVTVYVDNTQATAVNGVTVKFTMPALKAL